MAGSAETGRGAGPRAAAKIDRLTAIRFFAAAWVVVFHTMGYLHPDFRGIGPLVAHGEVAVDLFFVLSGFILAHVYYDGFARLDARSWATFLVRRLARIYPAHLMMLAAWIAYVLAGRLGGAAISTPERYEPTAILSNLLLVQAWGFERSLTWNYPAWSISAEWFAYLLFPPLCLLLHRLGRARPWLGLLLAEALLVGLDQGFNALYRTYDCSLLRIAPEFLAGMFLWQLRDRLRLPRPDLLLGFAIAGFVLLAASPVDRLPLVLAAQAVILLTYRATGPLGRLLAWPPLVYLGEVSYSLYMVHALVLSLGYRLLAKAAPLPVLQGWAPLVVLAILVAAQVAASLLFHLVEEPVRRAVTSRLRRAPPRRSAAAGLHEPVL
jgi:peptidoglycan/LPS O-acetylase OafA/YrhL